MTDRHYAYIVTLDHDIREDDAQPLLEAIGCIKHVISVQPLVADHAIHSAEDRAKHKYLMAMYDAIREVFEGKKST